MARVIRQAGKADLPQLAGALSRAFLEDPLWRWLAPDEPSRKRALPAMFGTILRHGYLPKGRIDVLLDGDSIRGGGIWMPPGRWKVSATAELRAVPGLVRALGLGRLRQQAEKAKLLDAALDGAHPDEPHWYLAILATDPDAQGQGVGTALLRERLGRLDRDGAASYLECNTANVPFYQHAGFQVTGDIPIGGTDIVMHSMWRDPHRS